MVLSRLESACRQLYARAGHPEFGQLSLAVNVNARQFHQADFVDQVQDVLMQSGCDPFRLKLGLTEIPDSEVIEEGVGTEQ